MAELAAKLDCFKPTMLYIRGSPGVTPESVKGHVLPIYIANGPGRGQGVGPRGGRQRRKAWERAPDQRQARRAQRSQGTPPMSRRGRASSGSGARAAVAATQHRRSGGRPPRP
jgi:hypothetical protein